MDVSTNEHAFNESVMTAVTGALLATALGNPTTQEVLTSKGTQGAVKRMLNTFRNINFRGEFDELRVWLKKGNSRPISPKRTPRAGNSPRPSISETKATS
jgi:hypothetical protein